MRIVIESLPTSAHMRYPTLGDWFYRMDESGRALVIQVTERDGANRPLIPDEQFLIALHELVEAKLCDARDITQAQVDAFDFAHIGSRHTGEPGDAPGAPYAREHRFAMIVEHLMAHELDMASYGRIE